MASISLSSSSVNYGGKVTISVTTEYSTGSFYTQETLTSIVAGSYTVWKGTITKNGVSTFTLDTKSLPIDSIGKTISVYAYYTSKSWIGLNFNTYTSTSLQVIAPPDWKPTLNISGSVEPNSRGFNGKILAGISTASLSGINAGYYPSDVGKSFTLKVQYVALSITGTIVNRSSTVEINNLIAATPVLPQSEENYVLTINVSNTDGAKTESKSFNEIVWGYKKPTPGENSYITRVDEDGNIDGNGSFGKLYIVPEYTSLDNENELKNVIVEKIDRTIDERELLVPIEGSIEEGYFVYIFPAPTEKDINFVISIEDSVLTNSVEDWFLPALTVPLSLFDDGQGTGVAIGRMATDHGFWIYSDLYLKSSVAGSGKVYQIKIDDDGQIFTSLAKELNDKLLVTLLDSSGVNYRVYINGIETPFIVQNNVKLISLKDDRTLVYSTIGQTIEVNCTNGEDYKLIYNLGENSDFLKEHGVVSRGKIVDENNITIIESTELIFKCTSSRKYRFLSDTSRLTDVHIIEAGISLINNSRLFTFVYNVTDSNGEILNSNITSGYVEHKNGEVHNYVFTAKEPLDFQIPSNVVCKVEDHYNGDVTITSKSPTFSLKNEVDHYYAAKISNLEGTTGYQGYRKITTYLTTFKFIGAAYTYVYAKVVAKTYNKESNTWSDSTIRTAIGFGDVTVNYANQGSVMKFSTTKGESVDWLVNGTKVSTGSSFSYTVPSGTDDIKIEMA